MRVDKAVALAFLPTLLISISSCGSQPKPANSGTPLYPSESKWSILQGQYQGKPMLVRRNDSAKQLSANSNYTYRVGIAIPLLNPNNDGFPTKEETAVLNAIEDDLSKELERDQRSIFVLAITTNGMREFVFYTHEPQMIAPALDSIRKTYAPREIQSYIREDAKWELYRQYAK
jgi:hypothetical protein